MFSLADDIIHPLRAYPNNALFLSFIGKLIQLNCANSESFIKNSCFVGKPAEIDY